MGVLISLFYRNLRYRYCEWRDRPTYDYMDRVIATLEELR